MNRETERQLDTLEALRDYPAGRELIQAAELARAVSCSECEVIQEVEQLASHGLVLLSDEYGIGDARVLNAGHQFLACDGRVSKDALRFLPKYIDNLDARQALLDAGTVVVRRFSDAMHTRRGGIEHARTLVPPAFECSVNARLAVRLFASLNAVVARLAAQEPAACVAEEVMAVAVKREARRILAVARIDKTLTADEDEAAAFALLSIFDLFGDDDVLDIFEMTVQHDAHVALSDPIRMQMGVVDQRLSAWFEAFNSSSATGHLDPHARRRISR